MSTPGATATPLQPAAPGQSAGASSAKWLVSTDDGGSARLQEASGASACYEALRRGCGDNFLQMISILGPAREGKSTLMNALVDSAAPPFRVGHSADPCTAGVDLGLAILSPSCLRADGRTPPPNAEHSDVSACTGSTAPSAAQVVPTEDEAKGDSSAAASDASSGSDPSPTHSADTSGAMANEAQPAQATSACNEKCADPASHEAQGNANPTTPMATCGASYRVALVDVEGQGDRSMDLDVTLALPILLTSKVVLFNWKGGFRMTTILNKLALLAKAAQRVALAVGNEERSIRTASGAAEPPKLFGHLHIVLRDWRLKSSEEAVYEKLMSPQQGSDSDDNLNAIRATIHTVFESVSVSLLKGHKHPGFLAGVAELRNRIAGQVSTGAKLFYGKPITGTACSQLIQHLVTAIESDSKLNLAASWQSVEQAMLEEAVDTLRWQLKQTADKVLAEALQGRDVNWAPCAALDRAEQEISAEVTAQFEPGGGLAARSRTLSPQRQALLKDRARAVCGEVVAAMTTENEGKMSEWTMKLATDADAAVKSFQRGEDMASLDKTVGSFSKYVHELPREHRQSAKNMVNKLAHALAPIRQEKQEECVQAAAQHARDGLAELLARKPLHVRSSEVASLKASSQAAASDMHEAWLHQLPDQLRRFAHSPSPRAGRIFAAVVDSLVKLLARLTTIKWGAYPMVAVGVIESTHASPGRVAMAVAATIALIWSPVWSTAAVASAAVGAYVWERRSQILAWTRMGLPPDAEVRVVVDPQQHDEAAATAMCRHLAVLTAGGVVEAVFLPPLAWDLIAGLFFPCLWGIIRWSLWLLWLLPHAFIRFVLHTFLGLWLPCAVYALAFWYGVRPLAVQTCPATYSRWKSWLLVTLTAIVRKATAGPCVNDKAAASEPPVPAGDGQSHQMMRRRDQRYSSKTASSEKPSDRTRSAEPAPGLSQDEPRPAEALARELQVLAAMLGQQAKLAVCSVGHRTAVQWMIVWQTAVAASKEVLAQYGLNEVCSATAAAMTSVARAAGQPKPLSSMNDLCWTAPTWAVAMHAGFLVAYWCSSTWVLWSAFVGFLAGVSWPYLREMRACLRRSGRYSVELSVQLVEYAWRYKRLRSWCRLVGAKVGVSKLDVPFAIRVNGAIRAAMRIETKRALLPALEARYRAMTARVHKQGSADATVTVRSAALYGLGRVRRDMVLTPPAVHCRPRGKTSHERWVSFATR